MTDIPDELVLEGRRRELFDLMKSGEEISIPVLYRGMFKTTPPQRGARAQKRLGPYISRLNAWFDQWDFDVRIKPGRLRGHYKLTKTR